MVEKKYDANEGSPEKALDREIHSEIVNLPAFDLGSDAHKQTVESIEKLYKAQTERLKVESDILLRQQEIDLKEKQIEQEKKSHKIDNAIIVGSTVASIGANSYWMLKGFKFEETGTITSRIFQNFMRNPFKGLLKK